MIHSLHFLIFNLAVIESKLEKKFTINNHSFKQSYFYIISLFISYMGMTALFTLF